MNIPYLSTPDKPLVSTTQDFIPIADIIDTLVLYKSGGAGLVLESTSLNFGLLSEKEQQAVIAAYAALLNSLTYTVQVMVRSQKKDISSYMAFLNQADQKIQNPKLKSIMNDYKQFILEAIKKKNVLSKKFYIVIPFSPLELGISKSFAAIRPGRKAGPLPFPKSYIVKKAKITLFPKRDHLMRQAGRLGIKLRPLDKEHLAELFYGIFNPEPPVKERVDLG